MLSLLSFLVVLVPVPQDTGAPRFVDASEILGLGRDDVPTAVSRLCFADLNDDGWPDVVLNRHLVYLNVAAGDGAEGRRFRAVPPSYTGLRVPDRGTVTVVVDVDDDGVLDAVLGEYVDARNATWKDHGRRTAWQRGNGDGTFGAPIPIPGVRPATTCAIAAGDVDLDGHLDLWLANWYVHYGDSLVGYANELVRRDGAGKWIVEALPVGADEELEEDTDLDGRPTYGAMIARLGGGVRPDLLELNYGRRWSRAWRWADGAWSDVAPAVGLDGDGIRHGQYPPWAIERMAQRDPPIELEPEKPFRSNGNSFDGAVGDVDNDGDFDVLLAEITHGWAGESSDRSRLLFNRLAETGELRFEYDARCCLDRVPEGVDNWNQGDLFCAMADLDHDTRLDLVVCSGDYPDNQRLRLWMQQEDGTFVERAEELGVDHDGANQVSLADVDGDGDLDFLVGQTFNRYTKEMREGREPLPRIFLNEATAGRGSITLRLEGDGKRVNRDALGAVVRATLANGVTMQRQLVGVGGHAGRQNDFLVHFGLGEADEVAELVVEWPEAGGATQRFEHVKRGRYALAFEGELQRREGE